MDTTKYTPIGTPVITLEKDDIHDGGTVIHITETDGNSGTNLKDSLLKAVNQRDFVLCQKLVTPQRVNAKDEAGTSLHILAKKHSKRKSETQRILLLLLKEGAKVSAKDKEGNTPIHLAAGEGHAEFLNTVFFHWRETQCAVPSLDFINKKGETPMHFAAQQGQSNMVSLLLEKGLNAALPDRNRYLPLHYAAAGGHYKCCELLRHTYPRDAPQKHDPPSPLMLAAKAGHEWCCKEMNLSAEDINYQDDFGNTALHITAKKCYDNFLIYLISKGANLDMKNKHGNTPIMEALSKYGSTCFISLMENGASLNLQNKQKRGVLHMAAERKADECMSYLLKHDRVREDIDKKDNSGCTPLLIAIKQDCEKCALMLLEADASPREECNIKVTPLHLATKNTATNILQRLLKFKDLDMNPVDKTGQTPLHLAAMIGSRETCLRILKRGARIGMTDKHNRSSLHIAAYFGHPSVVKLLIKKRAETKAIDEKKSTALHAAAKRGNFECCHMLVETNKSLGTKKDIKGRYPFDIAFQNDHNDIFEYLLKSLPFKSSNKLPSDMAKNLHAHTHRAIKEGCRAAIETIAKSLWWEAGFCVSLITKHEHKICDNFRQVIRLHPDLAKILMDKCTIPLTPTSKDYTYDFRLFEDNYYMAVENEDTNNTSGQTTNTIPLQIQKDPFVSETGLLKPEAREFIEDPMQWRREHPVRIIINWKRLNLLQHPLTKGWLSYKWNTYIRNIYCCLLLLNIFFVGSLVAFLQFVHNWHWISITYNVTENVTCQEILKQNNEIAENADNTSATICHVMLFISTLLVFIMEICNVLKLRKDYIRQITNLLRAVSAILAFVLLIPYPSCGTLIKPVFPWRCGVIAFMISCVSLFSTINKLPSCAIFANITHKFIKLYLKGLIMISMIIVTFAFIFHLLLLHDHQSFERLPQVIVKTVVWALGDLAYDDSFTAKKLSYPVLANLFFLLFICMVGAFIVSLIKTPSTDPMKLAFYKAATYANYQLVIDVCYPRLRKKHVIGKYCDEVKKLWIIKKLEQLCCHRSKDTFIEKKLYALMHSVTMMEIPNQTQPRLIKSAERILNRFNTRSLDEDLDDCSISDENLQKLEEQSLKLDQLLLICKQLVHGYQSQNEQIAELKHGYQMQNEQIAELKQHLEKQTITLKK